MTDTYSGPDNGRIDRWLIDRHRELVSDLATILDRDSGVRDLLLPAHHRHLVRDVSGVLNIDAGLAAVVGRRGGSCRSSGCAFATLSVAASVTASARSSSATTFYL